MNNRVEKRIKGIFDTTTEGTVMLILSTPGVDEEPILAEGYLEQELDVREAQLIALRNKFLQNKFFFPKK